MRELWERNGPEKPESRGGYAHWTGKPVTPDVHEVAFIPQTVVDGWEAYCSCGLWRASACLQDYRTRDAILAALEERHHAHVASVSS